MALWNDDSKGKINLMQDWASAIPKGGFPYKKKIWTWHLYMHLDMALKMMKFGFEKNWVVQTSSKNKALQFQKEVMLILLMELAHKCVSKVSSH
jgi:hypothetical protein